MPGVPAELQLSKLSRRGPQQCQLCFCVPRGTGSARTARCVRAWIVDYVTGRCSFVLVRACAQIAGTLARWHGTQRVPEA